MSNDNTGKSVKFQRNRPRQGRDGFTESERLFGRDLRSITKDADKQRSAKCSRNGIIEKKGEVRRNGPREGRSSMVEAN